MLKSSFNFKIWHIFQGVLGIGIFILGSQVVTGRWGSHFNFTSNISSSIVYLLFSSLLTIIRFQQRSNILNHIISTNETSLLLFLVDLLTFYGLFSLTLLPASGIGLIQWAVLLFFLFKYIVLKDSIVFDSLTLIFLVSALYLIKIIVIYFLPDDLFLSIIQFNKSIKIIIFLTTIIFAMIQIRDLSIIERLNINTYSVTTTGKNIFLRLIEAIKNGFLSILELFTLKSFVFVLIGFLLLSGIGLMVTLHTLNSFFTRFFTDFNNIFEALFKNFFTTDNTGTIQNFDMNQAQWASMLFFIIFVIVDSIIEKEQLKVSYAMFSEEICDEYNLVDNKSVILLIDEMPDRDIKYKCRNSDFKKYIVRRIGE